MTPISIKSIPHNKHRKVAGETVGDWYTRNGILNIRVSKMNSDRHEFLVAMHELIEKYLCDHDGVKEAQVDDFDFHWKEHDGIQEPGDDPKAPYHHQHCIAGIIERLIAVELGVEWDEYNREVMSL